MIDIIKIMAPGTPLREGLDSILRSRSGALIVIGDGRDVLELADGGFRIDTRYIPSHLYELAKMDGAIILSSDMNRIMYANVLLTPDTAIKTDETGTRHKSAQRLSKQTGRTVICISERRNVITVYRGRDKYILRNTETILARANQALQTLKKYRTVLDEDMNMLSVVEFENIVTAADVLYVIQRIEIVLGIADEVELYTVELGEEGRLICMQLEELRSGVENMEQTVLMDYLDNPDEKAGRTIERLRRLSYDELVDIERIATITGLEMKGENLGQQSLMPRGYRILGMIPKVPALVAQNLVKRFSSLQEILSMTPEELVDVEGIGEVRAKIIRKGLKRIREQVLLDSRRL